MYYKTTLAILVIACGVYLLLRSPKPLPEETLRTQLQDKVVLICGASSGIGEELAYQLAKFDTKLVLVARNQDKLDAVKDGVVKMGNSNVKTISYDFSDVKNASSVIRQTIQWFGKLDFLVSNHAAMVSGAFLASSYQQDPDYLEKIFRVNLFSQIELAIHALPHVEASKGHMFFTSSIAGEIPGYNMGIYSSTKHAMNGFFYSLQQELLAKESTVSLTIGAFGLILTKDLNVLLNEVRPGFMDETPDFVLGDVKECARGMAESYVTRPQTMTYPQNAGYLMRLLWQFYPSYHEIMIKFNKPKGVEGTGYQELNERIAIGSEVKKGLKFQQGYDGN